MNAFNLHEIDDERVRTVDISKGGQISVPAEVRRRWRTDRVRIIDQGDHLVVRPVPTDPIEAVRGSLTLPAGMTSERLRDLARREDEVTESEGPGS
jgi:bifunctional DNA-binding transcriptional regulator/antitoxin component of YhaV-PrlF toxin-antitoxin module